MYKIVYGLFVMMEGYGVQLNRFDVVIYFLFLIGYICKKDDYKMWFFFDNFSFVGCILGKKLVIERRIVYVVCFNGRNYDRIIVEKNCLCIREDYEWQGFFFLIIYFIVVIWVCKYLYDNEWLYIN